MGLFDGVMGLFDGVRHPLHHLDIEDAEGAVQSEFEKSPGSQGEERMVFCWSASLVFVIWITRSGEIIVIPIPPETHRVVRPLRLPFGHFMN